MSHIKEKPKKSAGRGAEEYACIWDEVFPPSVTAGFTSSAFKGNVEADMPVVLSSIGKASVLAHMKQVHAADVKTIDSPGIYECDGIFTRSPYMALVVRTADCLPLVFHSEKENAIGVVHMGWRSAVTGILDNINFDLSSFTCVAGVGLRSCCYRVGEEFLEEDCTKAFVVTRNKSCYFDAVEFARRNLMRRGLQEKNFFDVGACSYCSGENFHSHRRTGSLDRTLSFIVRT